MRIIIETPEKNQSFFIPGPLTLQLLAEQVSNVDVQNYLNQPGLCKALYEELERCARHFHKLRLVEVTPAQGGDISVTLEEFSIFPKASV